LAGAGGATVAAGAWGVQATTTTPAAAPADAWRNLRREIFFIGHSFTVEARMPYHKRPLVACFGLVLSVSGAAGPPFSHSK
jgi:hypothetical protein